MATPPPADPCGAEPADADDDAPTRSWTVGRIAAIATMVAIIVFWTWIFAGGPKKQNPDYLDDRRFANRTEQRCKDLRAELAKLPTASATPTPAERVPVLEQATELVDQMVHEIAADAPRTGDDAVSVKGWLHDWRAYVAARREYAEKLRTDPKAEFLLTESGVKGITQPVDETIEVFAQVNGIPDCATPGDVG